MHYREGIDFLRCPVCDADCIPYKWIEHGQPMWEPDMHGKCPDCGAACVTNLGGDRDECVVIALEVKP